MHTCLIPLASLRLRWQHAGHSGGLWSLVYLDPNHHHPMQPSLLAVSAPAHSTLQIPLGLLALPYMCSHLPLLSVRSSFALSLWLFLTILPAFLKGLERFSHSAARILVKMSLRLVFPDLPLGHLEFTANRQQKQRPIQDARLQATQSFPTLGVARLSVAGLPFERSSLAMNTFRSSANIFLYSQQYYSMHNVLDRTLSFESKKGFCSSLYYWHVLSSYDSRSQVLVCMYVCKRERNKVNKRMLWT